MKHRSILFLFVTALVLMASCKKEQEFVTLGVDIQKNNTKMFVNGDNYPYWTDGDQVYVNDQAYPVTNIEGSSATIEQVLADVSGYRAVFPANIVTYGTIITSSTTIPVTLPAVQQYQLVDGHQRVNLPMGAFLDGGTRLVFNNLCSIVRVEVSNTLSTSITLDKIVIETVTARLSGEGLATVDGNASNTIEMSSSASHKATLSFALNPMTLPANSSTPTSFDIVVPEFSTDNVSITIYTTDGRYFSLQTTGALAHNTITSVAANVTELQNIVEAELVDGPTFRSLIPTNATEVMFEYNSSISSGTLLSTENSPVTIFGNLEGSTWKVATSAQRINANPNCKNMFRGYSINGYGVPELHLTSIEFGEGFNTSNVTNMENMFTGCGDLVDLDISMFNTSNVIYMDWMFEGCSNLTILDLSNFNTSNVIYMDVMFYGCSELRELNISNFNTYNVTSMYNMFYHCSSLTELNLSNFNTSNVTNMVLMFSECSGLINLDLSNFNTCNVTSMGSMFYGCRGLRTIDLSNFNTSNVLNTYRMFCGCSNLESLNLSSFSTSQISTMEEMFKDCKNLTNLNLSNFSMNWPTKTNMCQNLSIISRQCTITCPQTVKTALLRGTNIPSNDVAFTWVSPSSSK